jgi:hypothetical protein
VQTQYQRYVDVQESLRVSMQFAWEVHSAIFVARPFLLWRCTPMRRPPALAPFALHLCRRALTPCPLQVTCYEDSRLLKLFADVVKVLYDADVLGEDTVRYWCACRPACLPAPLPACLHACMHAQLLLVLSLRGPRIGSFSPGLRRSTATLP